MPEKLTNEEVDERLLERKIIRLENIDGCHKRTKWKCATCGFEWITTVSCILHQKQGCPKCAHRSFPYTNEEIDEKLKSKNIIRKENYVNLKTKILFACVVCGYEWKAAPNGIINAGNGCKSCSGNMRHTNESVDKKLEGKEIKRLGEVKNAHAPMLWKCEKQTCGYIWKSTIHAIINHNGGCPKCISTFPLSNESVDKKLEGRDIVRVDDVINKKTKIKWKCKKQDCGYEWMATPDSILNAKNGCRRCSNRVPITNEEVDARLVGKNIKRLENVYRTEDKIKWKCTKNDCGYIWTTSFHGLHGCARCNGREPSTNETVDRKLKDRPILRLENVLDGRVKIKWKCLIETCGHIWSAAPNNVTYKTGCPLCRFKTQKTIHKYLCLLIGERNFLYDKEKIYYTDKNHFRLDFFIKPNIIIEYHGEQHYKIIEFWGGEDAFRKQQLRDANLRKYCLENNFPLLEIPYTMKEAEWKIVIKEFLMNNCKELIIR